jgi:hypothetical protein
VAGCATPTGSAGHAGATANLKLTFHLDHSAGADQLLLLENRTCHCCWRNLAVHAIPEVRRLKGGDDG